MFYAPVSDFTGLHRAAQRGDEAEVRRLLQQGADALARDSEGRTPLHHAVMRGHTIVVDQLLAVGGPSLLLAKDILNCTPVHLAAVQNQVTLIIRLVDALLEDVEGRTPLHEVARRHCMQDFMAFLHLGWESATIEDDGSTKSLAELSPLWSVVDKVVDLKRPGLPTVQRILGWHPLHIAAMSGNVELIKRLVQQFECDLRVKSMNSWTPLHYAAAYNQVAAIEVLCSLGSEVAVQDAVGSTPMHVAAGEGHLEAIQTLVRLGCSPQVVDRDGCTPLYCAAAWNRVEAVRLLEKLQCPSSLRSLEGRTPMHVAAEQGWVELVDVLVTELGNPVDARDNYQFTPLHSAANGGHVEVIRRLARLKHDLGAKDYLGRTALHYAAMHGRAAAVDALVELGANLMEKDSRGGYTPLHLAADAGQCDTISHLVAHGAPVDAPAGQCSKLLPPLALALMKGPSNVDAIALLVEMGADVQLVLEHRSLETPLHVAARSGRLDILQRLIACPGISLAVRTKDGSTPLHYAAAFGQTHVLEPLVDAGCPIDARDNALNTPVHLAAGCGFLDTVIKLVELGADVNARDCTDCTPLQNAAHGTYSALAAMPSSGAGGGGPSSASSSGGAVAASTSGYARFNPPHQPQLTPAQQAAQAALSTSSAIKRDGLVPVRTGLAWSQPYSGLETTPLPPGPPPLSLPGSGSAPYAAAALDMVSVGGAAGINMNATTAAIGSAQGAGSGSNPTHDLWSTWKSLGLTQLLKKAYKQQQKRADRGGTGSSCAHQAAAQLQQTQQSMQAALQQMQAALQQSQAALQQQLLLQLQQQQQHTGSATITTDTVAINNTNSNSTGNVVTSSSTAAGTILSSTAIDGGKTSLALTTATAPTVPASENLDALLRRSEQLHMSSGEADRSRLISVVEKLVDLGADLHAVDNEGRTALHLAAGCGDRNMAVRLVELGTDVNCRDSVGGTAMHHAAMANKKEMMYALARLGCDWRARADGIDGATASFVLCGQHGKTTRQQRLLDAKLKRVYQEGAVARSAGRNPLVDAKDEDVDDMTMDMEAEQALADAAMQALLEEEEARAEEEAKKAAKKAAKKKKGGGGKDAPVAAAAAAGAKDKDKDERGHLPPGESSSEAAAGRTSPSSGYKRGDGGEWTHDEAVSTPGVNAAMPIAGPGRSRESSGCAEVASSEASEHDPAKLTLEAMADGAARLLAEMEEPDEDALQDILEELDDAIEKAVAVGVSAKYGKKVRKKLQTALDRARGVLPFPTVANTTASSFDALAAQAPMQPTLQQRPSKGAHLQQQQHIADTAVKHSGNETTTTRQPRALHAVTKTAHTSKTLNPPGAFSSTKVSSPASSSVHRAVAAPPPSAKPHAPPGFSQGSQPAMPTVTTKQQHMQQHAWARPPPPPPPPPPPRTEPPAGGATLRPASSMSGAGGAASTTASGTAQQQQQQPPPPPPPPGRPSPTLNHISNAIPPPPPPAVRVTHPEQHLTPATSSYTPSPGGTSVPQPTSLFDIPMQHQQQHQDQSKQEQLVGQAEAVSQPLFAKGSAGLGQLHGAGSAGLFGDPGLGSYESTSAAVTAGGGGGDTPSATSSNTLFGSGHGGLFATTTTATATTPQQETSQSGGRPPPGFGGLGAAYVNVAAAQFGDLELSPSHASSYAATAAARASQAMGASGGDVAASSRLDSFIGHDLAAHVFGNSSGMVGLRHEVSLGGGPAMVSGGMDSVTGLQDSGAGYLSMDLLGAIDGTSASMMHGGSMPHEAAGHAHLGGGHNAALNGSLEAASGARSLPEDAASLFAPSNPQLVGMQNGQSHFHSLW